MCLCGLNIQSQLIKRGDYMTLLEMKTKVLGLIEELNPESENLTDDPDIETKINDVINQVMFELARMKKIPRYIEKLKLLSMIMKIPNGVLSAAPPGAATLLTIR